MTVFLYLLIHERTIVLLLSIRSISMLTNTIFFPNFRLLGSQCQIRFYLLAHAIGIGIVSIREKIFLLRKIVLGNQASILIHIGSRGIIWILIWGPIFYRGLILYLGGLMILSLLPFQSHHLIDHLLNHREPIFHSLILDLKLLPKILHQGLQLS